MNEENQNATTTTNENPQKKKGGKAKKIIIALVAILLIVAIVVGILLATGVLDFNLSKKSKMVAGVDQLIESYSAPMETISESSEKNNTYAKVLDNINKDSGIAVKAEVSGKIDELEINALSSSEQRTMDSIKELINSASVGMDVRYDGKKSGYMNVNGTLDDTSISGEIVYDGEKLGMRSEELNSKWLTLSNEELDKAMSESDVDMEELKETLNTTMTQVDEIVKSAKVDEKTQKELEEKYEKVLKDYINEKAKDIESEKDKVTVDGKEKSCEKLTIKLKEKDLKKLLIKYIDTFKEDETTQNIIKNTLKSMSEISEELNSEDMAEQFDELMNSIDELKEEINNTEIDATLTLTVYATNTNVYRTDIAIEAEETVVTLETTFNKEETVTEVIVKSSGASVNVGKVTIKSDDNEVSMKVETSKDLNKMIGVDEFSVEIVSKVEKSKSETKIDVNAGSYGKGNISITNNVNKNEDKEYDETLTIAADVNIPSIASVKAAIDVKANIKASDIEIPTISEADSVSMTDQAAVEAYGKEAETKLKELTSKLSENKVIKTIVEEAMDSVNSSINSNTMTTYNNYTEVDDTYGDSFEF